ncbi:aspartic protease, partial [Aphelenchoides avenae]
LAFSDTGVTTISGPPDVIRHWTKNVLDTKQGNDGTYWINCDTKFSIVFMIDGYRYEVMGHQLKVSRPNGAKSGKCQLMLKATQGHVDWVLGVPFIRQFCHIHDYGARELRLAPAFY